jgi:hypothetical protein
MVGLVHPSPVRRGFVGGLAGPIKCACKQTLLPTPHATITLRVTTGQLSAVRLLPGSRGRAVLIRD